MPTLNLLYKKCRQWQIEACWSATIWLLAWHCNSEYLGTSKLKAKETTVVLCFSKWATRFLIQLHNWKNQSNIQQPEILLCFATFHVFAFIYLSFGLDASYVCNSKFLKRCYVLCAFIKNQTALWARATLQQISKRWHATGNKQSSFCAEMYQLSESDYAFLWLHYAAV